MMVSFLKMNGAGNDFVVIDNRAGMLADVLRPVNWRKVADRHFGIGCDQVILLEHSSKADVFMRIINADGSESGACGNASRCIGRILSGEKKTPMATIETVQGLLASETSPDGLVTLDMGEPRLQWDEIPLAQSCDTLRLPVETGTLRQPVAVNMGNPHMVFFVDSIEDVPLAEIGPVLEHHSLFPERANVEVVQIDARNAIRLHVWERGTGLTLACGTGACAALVAACLRGYADRKAKVTLPGGDLFIEWNEADNRVRMTGPAEVNYEGTFDAETYR